MSSFSDRQPGCLIISGAQSFFNMRSASAALSGHLLLKQGRRDEAADSFRRAAGLSEALAVRAFLLAKISG